MDLMLFRDPNVFKVEMEGVPNEHSICLICCDRKYNRNQSKNEGENYNLSKQFEAIFVLRKLLKVSSTRLEYYLKQSADGTGPECWISLCGKCKLLVDQAKELYSKIVIIKKRVKGIQNEIVDKIKRSSSSVRYTDEDEEYEEWSTGQAKQIWEETRAWALMMEYDMLEDPFVDGDRQAKELADRNANGASATTTTSALLEEEKEVWGGEASSEQTVVKEEIETIRTDDDDDDCEPLSSSPCTSALSTKNQRGKVGKIKRRRPRQRAPKIEVKTEIPVKHICRECGKTFKFGQPYQRHLAIAHKIKKMRCEEEGCDKSFSNVRTLTRHLKWHDPSNRPKLTCEFCGLESINKNSLQHHRKFYHLTTRIPIKCPICDKLLLSEGNLRIHIRRVHKVEADGTPIPQTKVVCDQCGTIFGSQSCLKDHIQLVHEGKFRVTCHLCGIQVQTKASLKRHILNVHKDQATQELGDNAQLFRCPVIACPNFYYSKEKLEDHMEKIHKNGEEDEDGRPFKCSFCAKGFFKMGKLKDHELIHINEGTTPYKCGICGKGYSLSKYCRRHFLRKHGMQKGATIKP